MNRNNIIVYDFETGGKDPYTCEPIQIAAVAIDPRKLTLGLTFDSLMKPLEPDKLEEGALQVNKKTREELANAPHPELVWKEFATYIAKFNPKGNPFNAPIGAGFNIRNFDTVLVHRLCEKYGPQKDGKQNLFSNFMIYDVLDDIFRWHENTDVLAKFSDSGRADMKFSTIRKYVGLSQEGAHDALNDVLATGRLLVKLMKLYRGLFPKIRFEGAFDGTGH